MSRSSKELLLYGSVLVLGCYLGCLCLYFKVQLLNLTGKAAFFTGVALSLPTSPRTSLKDIKVYRL